MYESVCRLEEEKYDWEFKLRKMDFEVIDWECIGMRLKSERPNCFLTAAQLNDAINIFVELELELEPRV